MGLVSVNPTQLHRNTNPPPVMIESVLIAGREQNTNKPARGWLRAVTVPADQERLEIHYTSLNLADPDRARFSTGWQTNENAWTEAGNSRVARYSILRPSLPFSGDRLQRDGV